MPSDGPLAIFYRAKQKWREFPVFAANLGRWHVYCLSSCRDDCIPISRERNSVVLDTAARLGLVARRRLYIPVYQSAALLAGARMKLLNWVVVVIDPSYAGVRSAVTMQTLLAQMREGRMPATKHLQSPELVRLTEEAYRRARCMSSTKCLMWKRSTSCGSCSARRASILWLRSVLTLNCSGPGSKGLPWRARPARPRPSKSSARWRNVGAVSRTRTVPNRRQPRVGEPGNPIN
jgi:hypothetical protein